MKHPYITDKKYLRAAVFLILFIGAAYYTGYLYDSYLFAHIVAGVFSIVAVIGYFAMKK
jgi:general stress protein CsbA